ncbi:Putative uncharacterized protein [Leuconostoc citreum]|nr:Putative uncharacterized protein [Leuconostoc citreum]
MDSLWWAIATTTTVGYGDISPHTEVGRFVAIVLMIVGIGLIGSVTSTVTAYFVEEKKDETKSNVENELQELKNQVKLLNDYIRKEK